MLTKRIWSLAISRGRMLRSDMRVAGHNKPGGAESWAHPLGRVYVQRSSTGAAMLSTVLDATVRPDAADPSAHQEAAARTLRIDCDRIVRVAKVRTTATERIAFETERVPGVPLTRKVAEGPMNAAYAAAILVQVAYALAVAHRADLHHGALTTASVLVDADGVARVTDFGIGPLCWDEHTRNPESVPTSPARVMGLDRSPAEDVYLFGCVAYAMLTGQPVFATGNAEEIRRSHAIEDAPRVSESGAGRAVPRPLRDLVRRCLAKEPEDRFADGTALLAALRRALSEAGITTPFDDIGHQKHRKQVVEAPSPMTTMPSKKEASPPKPAAESPRALSIPAPPSRRPSTDPRPTPVVPAPTLRPPPNVVASTDPRPTPVVPMPILRRPHAQPPKTTTPVAVPVLHLAQDPTDPRPTPIVDRPALRPPPAPEAPSSSRRLPGAPVPITAPPRHLRPTPRRRGRLLLPTAVAAVIVAGIGGLWLAVEHRVIDTELPVLTALASEPDVGDPGPERAVTAEVVPAAHDVAPVAQEPAYEEVVVVEPEPEPEPEPEGDPPPPPEDTQQPKQPDRDRPAAAKPEVDVGALLHRAEEARAHGDGKRAAALFEDVLRHRPRNLGALKGLSKLAFNRGDHKAAIGYLRRAVKVAPRDGDLRIRLGDAHYKLGQYTQARTHFTKAAENGHPSARRRLDLLQDAAGS